MTQNIEHLRLLVGICVLAAAIFSTAFPLLYGTLSPWYRSRLGRALLLQATSLALAIDTTLIFAIWRPDNVLVVFWVNVVVFLLIAGSTGYLTWKMFKHNVVIPLRGIGFTPKSIFHLPRRTRSNRNDV